MASRGRAQSEPAADAVQGLQRMIESIKQTKWLGEVDVSMAEVAERLLAFGCINFPLPACGRGAVELFHSDFSEWVKSTWTRPARTTRRLRGVWARWLCPA